MRALLLFQLLAVFLFAEAIRQYDVTIDLHEDGSLGVKEVIDYDFGPVRRHGIFRDIPKMVTGRYGLRSIGLGDFSVTRDGVPEPFEKLTVGGDAGPMVRLKIGRGETFLTGSHRYTIAYRVAHGILSAHDGRDAMRWNAVGTGWEVPIDHARVTVRLPEKLLSRPIEWRTFSGPYGSTTTRALLTKKAPDLYEASVDALAPHEGLTVEAAFPKGSLGQSGDFDEGFTGWMKRWWAWIVLTLFTLGVVLYWYRHGKDPAIGSIAPMYGPPEGIDVLKAGLLIDQFADNEDIAAAIVDLARLGYLTIEERATGNPLAEIPLLGKVFKGKEIVLVKTDKDTKGLPPEYRTILKKMLFPHGTREFRLFERSDERAKRFREGFEKINESLYEWAKTAGYMRENPETARKSFIVKASLALVPFLLPAAWQTGEMLGDFSLLFPLLFVSAFFAVGAGMLVLGHGASSKITAVFFLFVPLIIGFSAVADLGLENGMLSIPLFILLLAIFPILFFARHMGVYTPKGARAYRHLLGFKEFIERVKEDELRRFLEEDPNYLDKTLPYAMLFGKADHWLKFYALTAAGTPLWYDGDEDTLMHLDRPLSRFGTMSQTASSGGGVSGGGGFSGGGGGGGGGGSW